MITGGKMLYCGTVLRTECYVHNFYTFSSTKSVKLNTGRYYYEARLVTEGDECQIGFCTPNCNFTAWLGIGDDKEGRSIAIDPCRRFYWFKDTITRIEGLEKQKYGDVIGCIIDTDNKSVTFTVNGKLGETLTQLFDNPDNQEFYAGVSINECAQVEMNLGNTKFKYPPSTVYKAFNYEESVKTKRVRDSSSDKTSSCKRPKTIC